ncbi:DUF4232 domain-containing protein [Nocardioides sp. MH1]|uniref:DUF4232 domain-containing protein n=1 Tax=Nocardioides sp. MH1 TaxID=3242490 RepID=UPI0035218652
MPRTDRDSIAAAATVAVLLALAIGFFVVNRDDSSTTPEPPTTQTGLAPCGAGDLVLGQQQEDSADGSSYVTATLRLGEGAEPCTVEGYPRTIVLSDGRPAGVPTVSDQTLGRPRELTVLPDRAARVTLAWAVSHYCGAIVNDSVRLWLAPDLPVDLPGFGATRCDGDEGRPPVRVGAFTYVDPRAERGTVTGLVTLNDGPEPGTGEYAHSGQVEFTGADTFRAPIRTDGSYRLSLPTGGYDVRVTTHQWHAGERYYAGSFSVSSGELGELNIPLPAR